MRQQLLRALAFSLIALQPGVAGYQWARAEAPASVHVEFVTHAAFFSKEMHLAKALDPQVFVRERGAPAGVGPQNIKHVAGYRNLRISDASNMEIYSAEGKPLGFTAGSWLGARGTVTITPSGNGADITATFQGLKPNGVYSLFENHFDVKPVSFTPLDGKGTANSFVAGRDGAATIRVHSPAMLTSVNAVLLVYHSDDTTHGASRGEIGVNAHHELIAKLP